jgi:N,N'-diacetyllegionaminate synthase
LVDLGMPLVKISSGLLTNLPLITRCARTGLPMVLSTGMSDLDEVRVSVRAAEEAGCAQLLLLHCTSLYPAPADTLNLRALQTLAGAFQYPVGYSDHYDGTTAALAATALGARAIEKHFTLDRNGGGPDDAYAADTVQLAALVAQVREIERMMGTGIKAPVEAEVPGRNVYRRCLVASRLIAAGEVLSEDAIACKRPRAGDAGLTPDALPRILGMRAARAIDMNESIRFEMLTT